MLIEFEAVFTSEPKSKSHVKLMLVFKIRFKGNSFSRLRGQT